jgi:TolB-like protein/tetratricopeptide (TPR) repeat protein
MTLPAGTRLGPYEVISPIGAGGMGEVYRAKDSRLDRDVAIKVLPAAFSTDPDRLRRFEQEARAASALNHPNIVTVHDLGSQGGAPYVVSELLDGDALRDRLAGGGLPPRKALDYAHQIARGLAAAHGKGIVHRDLKPENLFVTRDGRVKILDFGLAKLTSAESDRPGLSRAITLEGTEPGVLLGTVGYMSPEQVRGKPLDTRSDIFAFGAIFYEMLAGRRAFLAESPIETMNAILRDEPPELPAIRDLPAGLDRIVRRCLEKEAADRFQSAQDLAFMLETLSGTAARPEALRRSPVGTPAGQRSVAVLPFKDLARDPHNAHVGIGLADATITELALVKSLLVRPTAAVLRYQDVAVDPQEAGRELGVDAVADGSFLRSGSRMRVTVQLVATEGGKHLWGTKIDTSLEDVFGMQDEVSRRIAEALQVELSPGDERRMAGMPRPGGRAYELCLKGRYLLFSDTNLADLTAAIELFEQAREVDPQSVMAMVGLTDAYARMGFSFDPDGDWYARAEAMCAQALALAPDLPEGRYLRGRLLWNPRSGFAHGPALREFLTAVAGRPSLVEGHHHAAMVMLHVSLLEEATARFEMALAINPGDQFAELHRALSIYLRGRYSEARTLTEDIVPRAASPWAPYQLGMCRIRLGEMTEAARVLEQAARRFPGDMLFHSLRAVLAAREGDRALAREQVDLIVGNRKAFGHYHHAQYDVACVHALLGDPAASLEWLGEASRNGFPCVDFFARDPLLEALHGGAEFDRLLDALRVEQEGYRAIHRALGTASEESKGSSEIRKP